METLRNSRPVTESIFPLSPFRFKTAIHLNSFTTILLTNVASLSQSLLRSTITTIETLLDTEQLGTGTVDIINVTEASKAKWQPRGFYDDLMHCLLGLFTT